MVKNPLSHLPQTVKRVQQIPNGCYGPVQLSRSSLNCPCRCVALSDTTNPINVVSLIVWMHQGPLELRLGERAGIKWSARLSPSSPPRLTLRASTAGFLLPGVSTRGASAAGEAAARTGQSASNTPKPSTAAGTDPPGELLRDRRKTTGSAQPEHLCWVSGFHLLLKAAPATASHCNSHSPARPGQQGAPGRLLPPG